MLKKSINLGVYASIIGLFFQCESKKDFKTDESGLMYAIIEDKEGTPAKQGDILTLDLLYKAQNQTQTPKDSVLFDSKVAGKPLTFMLPASSFAGSFEDALSKLSEGDSAQFQINADSLFEKSFRMPLPPFIEKGSKILFAVKMNKIQTKEQFEKEMSNKAEEQKQKDEATIVQYMADNKMQGTKLSEGVYYVVGKEGTGKMPANGDTVSVHYTGKLLSGKVFDSSKTSGKPIEFPIGAGYVIKGWDIGISAMKEGETGVLVIPSSAAYGANGAGGVIPPNAVLVFDVELKAVKAKK